MSLIDLMGSPIASQRLYWLFTWNYFSFVGLHDVYIFTVPTIHKNRLILADYLLPILRFGT